LKACAARGFIRARIDGLVCDLDEAPALDKKKKHTIEVVVDRFKVKADIGLRLAESFETALALAEGLAMISYMDGDQPDQILSAKFACPICNYSLNELEPRLFSFNNPAGACPTCDGLGVHQFFDIDRGDSASRGLYLRGRYSWMGSPHIVLLQHADQSGRALQL
jgi:excinuclease ABC subunit A